jgi:hypothetical protein
LALPDVQPPRAVLGAAMSARRTTPEEKLGTSIRLLASEQDGEVIAAARAIGRILKSCGKDIHALAEHAERMNGGSGLSEAEMKKIYDAGYNAGVHAVENKQHGAGDFHSVDEPTWHEIACECATHDDRLRDERERQFVRDMARRTVRGGEPTEKQAHWLHAIYARIRR